MKNTEKIYNRFLECKAVSIDSREILKDALFFSLKGENFNGNQYAREALEKGCKYAIVDEEKYVEDDRFILVDNVLSTLQELANYHRLKLNPTVIGITGSNGKTTTKELIHQVIQEKYNTLATKKNYNNHIGVPLTLLELKSHHEFAIIEMGANHTGEIKNLCQIADPDYGLITNIGKAHLEGFGSYEKVIQAKSELYDHICNGKGTIFLNKDNSLLEKLTKERKCLTHTYGSDKSAECKGELLKTVPFLKIKTDELTIKTQITGKYNFENILASVAIGKFFQVSNESISRAIGNYIPENNRSQIVKTNKNEIILDAYNANPTSMSIALENFHEMDRDKKTLILGDMFELGKYSHDEHQTIINKIKTLGFKRVYLVGGEFQKVTHGDNHYTFKNAEELISHIKKHPIVDSSILIKGSRGMALEKVVEYL
jgi:UDP-N-acetylmuramoyl-tripeptide--D-alanyl-D-alanine ligase